MRIVINLILFVLLICFIPSLYNNNIVLILLIILIAFNLYYFYTNYLLKNKTCYNNDYKYKDDIYCIPNTKYMNNNNNNDIEKKLVLRENRIEIINDNLENKFSVNLLPIKDIVSKELDKKMSNKENIIITDSHKVIYDSIIRIINNKGYSTSKCFRIYKSIRYINIEFNNLTIYIDYNELDKNDLIPFEDITNEIKKSINNYNLIINYKEIRYTNIFNYFINNHALNLYDK